MEPVDFEIFDKPGGDEIGGEGECTEDEGDRDGKEGREEDEAAGTGRNLTLAFGIDDGEQVSDGLVAIVDTRSEGDFSQLSAEPQTL